MYGLRSRGRCLFVGSGTRESPAGTPTESKLRVAARDLGARREFVIESATPAYSVSPGVTWTLRGWQGWGKGRARITAGGGWGVERGEPKLASSTSRACDRSA
jgi:hypothetical protein